MFFKKLKYRFDNLMARGTVVMMLTLFCVTLAVVLLAGFLAMLLDSTEHSFLHSSWKNFMYTLDAGNLSGAEGNAAFLFIAFLVTLCGLFFTSALIGIINSGIDRKMSDLRRGKSLVIERGHIVVLGFNETALLILKQLVISGENVRRQVVVIMDDKNKDEMEDEIRQQIPCAKTTRFVCRSGKLDNILDLAICSLAHCRSVIIASDDDYHSLKAVLAITKILNQAGNSSIHITATVNDVKNIPAFRIAGAERIEAIVMQHTIARIIAHSCLQPGISAAFTELFNFEGVEIYIEEHQGAAGLRFGQACLKLPNATLIGLLRDGAPLLNPPADTLLLEKDKLVVIAEDDSISHLSNVETPVDESRFSTDFVHTEKPRHMMVLGFSPLLLEILAEEDKYLPAGSLIQVACPPAFQEAPDELKSLNLKNAELSIETCDIFRRGILESHLDERLDNVLVMSDLTVSKEQSDNKSMLLLLLLRDISKNKGLAFSITTEIQNSENQQLIALENSTDFVISSLITAMIASQISQTRALSAIFNDLLDEEGVEIYLKPAERYVRLDAPVDFLTATAAVIQKQEVMIGYRRKTHTGQYMTMLNPMKADSETFAPGDQFIVIAES